MARMSRAAVQIADRQIEVREFPIPQIGEDDALLRIEATGICGTDYEQYQGELKWVRYPVIPGHEPMGIIEEIGERAAQRWGVRPGDRVVVEPMVPCGSCERCLTGHYVGCTGLGRLTTYGYMLTDRTPGL